MMKYIEEHAGPIILILFLFVAVEVIFYIFKKMSRRTGYKEVVSDVIIENSDDVQILINKSDSHIVYVTSNTQEVLGIAAEAIQANIYILESLVNKKVMRRLSQAIEKWDKTSVFSKEFPFHIFDTTEQRYGRFAIKPIQNEKYYLVTVRDISQEKKIREKLEGQIKEIESLDESKTLFLSKMSHEIRTPMNGMLGMISLAKMSLSNQNGPEAGEYLEKAEGLSQFLLSIINDILDMSRIESGKLELESREFSLPGLGEKISTMFQTTIEDKGIQFVIDFQDFNVHYVKGDELRITQVISNLLSNASKFTEKGGKITVTFRQMDVIDNKLSFMIKVSDTGKGMSPEFLHRIFIPFEQEDSGIARQYGGSGLGMAISDNLVHMMGGQILVDSEEGKGSTFTIFLELPIVKKSQAEIQQEERAKNHGDKSRQITLSGRRILMAEDNAVNALVATKILSTHGLKIEVASNGLIAIQMFTEHEAGYYDAILMDIHMPEMDGWEATKQIRKMDNEEARTIPIFALSADAFVEDKRHSMEVGMNGHVTKPIDYEELEQALLDNIKN